MLQYVFEVVKISLSLWRGDLEINHLNGSFRVDYKEVNNVFKKKSQLHFFC